MREDEKNELCRQIDIAASTINRMVMVVRPSEMKGDIQEAVDSLTANSRQLFTNHAALDGLGILDDISKHCREGRKCVYDSLHAWGRGEEDVSRAKLTLAIGWLQMAKATMHIAIK